MIEKVIWCLIKVIVDERMDVKVMEFTVGDSVRFGFGFANPNHAAAAVCALAPFLWGWWIGKVERRGGGRQWRFASCCCRGVGAESRLRDARGSRISS